MAAQLTASMLRRPHRSHRPHGSHRTDRCLPLLFGAKKLKTCQLFHTCNRAYLICSMPQVEVNRHDSEADSLHAMQASQEPQASREPPD